MHTDNKNIMLVDYCRADEIPACKLKLKAELFSTFCKLAKEGEKYIFTFWYSQVPLSKNSQSVQLAINAVIKDRRTDTEDIFRKIIPYTGRTLFSMFSGIFKLNKNHNEYIIGEKKMIIKCPKCGSVIPCSSNNETTLLKEEIKNKDLLIEQLRKEISEYETVLNSIQAEEAPIVEETTEAPATVETEVATEEAVKPEETVTETPVETVAEVATESVVEPVAEEITETIPTAEEPAPAVEEETPVENEVATDAAEVNTSEETASANEPVETVETNEPETAPETVVEENIPTTEPVAEAPVVEETVSPIEETSPVVEEPVEAIEEKKEIENEPAVETTEEPKEETKPEEDPYHIHTPFVVTI